MKDDVLTTRDVAKFPRAKRQTMSSESNELVGGDESIQRVVFCCMWVVAACFHMLHRSDVVASVPSAISTIAAIYFFLRPQSIDRFAYFCGCQAVLFVYHSPDTGNHEFFGFYGDLVILLVYGATRLAGGRREAFARFFVLVAPILRLGVLTLYFFAVFHKLNATYLHPASCGGDMPVKFLLHNPLMAWLHLGSFLSIDSAGFRIFCVYASLTIEALTPILLATTRAPWGVLLGTLFHVFLGMIYFWDFTPMMLALYSLFMPPSFHAQLAGWTQRAGAKRINWANRTVGDVCRTVVIGIGVSLPLLFLLAQDWPALKAEIGAFSRLGPPVYEHGIRLRTLLGFVPFLLYSLVFLVATLRCLRGSECRPRLQWRIHPALAVLAFALVVNGFSPYLGLKNHQSFAMFASLKTHGGKTNHLFMPMIEISDVQHDLVTPLDVGDLFDGNFHWRLQKGTGRMTFYEFHKQISLAVAAGRTGIKLSYVRNGHTDQIQNAENVAELAKPVSWLEHKFRIFRPAHDTSGCFY